MSDSFFHLDEKHHVENPFLHQLEKMPGISWNVLRLDTTQVPQDTQRVDFSGVVMRKDLETALLKINPWLDDQQLFEAVADITSFEGDNLLKNNRRVLDLLINGTRVPCLTDTGLRNEPVQYIDFNKIDNNSFVAVSQFKVRIPGTDQHIYPDIICFLNGLPVAVIECKSPKTKEPIPEAIDQMMRYCEQRGYRKEGSKQLFY